MIPAIYNLPDAYRGDAYGPISLKIKDSSGGFLSVAGNQINLHVKNKKNCAIVMDNKLKHRVLPIIEGDRYSFVCFFEKGKIKISKSFN